MDGSDPCPTLNEGRRIKCMRCGVFLSRDGVFWRTGDESGGKVNNFEKLGPCPPGLPVPLPVDVVMSFLYKQVMNCRPDGEPDGRYSECQTDGYLGYIPCRPSCFYSISYPFTNQQRRPTQQYSRSNSFFSGDYAPDLPDATVTVAYNGGVFNKYRKTSNRSPRLLLEHLT